MLWISRNLMSDVWNLICPAERFVLLEFKSSGQVSPAVTRVRANPSHSVCGRLLCRNSEQKNNGCVHNCAKCLRFHYTDNMLLPVLPTFHTCCSGYLQIGTFEILVRKSKNHFGVTLSISLWRGLYRKKWLNMKLTLAAEIYVNILRYFFMIALEMIRFLFFI